MDAIVESLKLKFQENAFLYMTNSLGLDTLVSNAYQKFSHGKIIIPFSVNLG